MLAIGIDVQLNLSWSLEVRTDDLHSVLRSLRQHKNATSLDKILLLSVTNGQAFVLKEWSIDVDYTNA